MNNNELIITLIFAAVAAFVLFKLRSVLGRRTGHEQQRDMLGGDAEPASDNVLKMPERRPAETIDVEPGSALDAGLRQIAGADPNFDPADFLAGAKAAFERIVGAFAAGDRDALKPLLSADVFASFETAIAEREKAKQTLDFTFVGFKSADLTAAELAGRTARVTMTFVTEQSSAVRDENGALVEGDPTDITTVTDVWTFSRDTRSRDPNWELVETGANE